MRESISSVLEKRLEGCDNPIGFCFLLLILSATSFIVMTIGLFWISHVYNVDPMRIVLTGQIILTILFLIRAIISWDKFLRSNIGDNGDEESPWPSM